MRTAHMTQKPCSICNIIPNIWICGRSRFYLFGSKVSLE